MTPSPCADTAPATAAAATLARLRRRLPRTLLFMAVLCLTIAAMLTVFERGGFVPHLIYSTAIGICCWLLTDSTRLALAWLGDRLRALRRLPQSPAGFQSGWSGIVPGVLVSVLLGPAIGMSLADALTGHTSPSLFTLSAANTRITLAMTVVAALASVVVLSLMERLSAASARAEAAQRLAAENQLRLLQSQLQPHMLFNTLANVRVLIGLDPPRAQAMLDRMIAFLRATLNASRVDSHALSAEFDRTADYLALMAVRMGERLQVNLDLPEALRDLQVPPLLLQPLVENAIQHGIEPNVAGGRIDVQARRVGSQLVLAVRDTGVGLQAQQQQQQQQQRVDGNGNGAAGTGFGLRQVRERLATLYGSNGSLELTAADGGGTLANVRMPAP